VITADTAIAHLAGALGWPAWIMLQTRPDLGWLRERNNSPWSPSLRLFRQRRPGHREDVIQDVRTR
jgi:ADP-heptose:LPS heptosyltransferase